MVANAPEVRYPAGGIASPPGRNACSARRGVRAGCDAFAARHRTPPAGAAGRRACAGAHRRSGNPSDTAGASAPAEIPTDLGNPCLGVFGGAARIRFGFDSIRFAAGRRGARANRDQCPHARRRSAGRAGLPGVPEERPRRRPRRISAGARARADQPRRAPWPRGHRRAQRPAQLCRSALSQAARDRPARQSRSGEPHLAARPARPGGFGVPLEKLHRKPARDRASALLARQPVRAAVALERSAGGVLQSPLGRSGKCRLRLQSRRQSRSATPGKAGTRVLPARACLDRQARGELRPRPRAAARAGVEQRALAMNSPRLSAQAVSPQAKRHIGQILISQGILTEDQLRIALLEQLKTHQPVGKLLVNLGFVSEATLRDALSEKLGLQSVDLTQIVVDSVALKLVPREFSKRHTIFPVALDREARKLIIAIADTNNIVALDQVRAQLRGEFSLEMRLAGEGEIGRAIDQYYGHDFSIDGILHEIETGEIDYQSLQSSGDAYSQPVVRLISALLADAVERGASDIHFEPEQSFLRIRYRIDGVRRQIRSLHKTYWPAMAVRIKVMSKMNIAETRAPQDGRISLMLTGRAVDFARSVQR